jgi:hypothetical protein
VISSFPILSLARIDFDSPSEFPLRTVLLVTLIVGGCSLLIGSVALAAFFYR